MKKIAMIGLLMCVLPVGRPGTMMSASPTMAEQCPPAPAVVARFLEFTNEQGERFGGLLTQLQSTVSPVQEQLALNQQRLELQLGQPNPDAGIVGTLVLQIHALQKQVGQAIQGFQTAFAGLLTQEQRQKIGAVTQASQLQPVLGAFVSLHLVAPPPALPCPTQ